MPEFPDIVVYIEALERFVGGRTIEAVEVRSPFTVRTVEPELASVVGKAIRGFRRLGKRIAWQLDGDLWLVFHLMIAGRFHWKKPGTRARGKNDLLAFQFSHGTLLLTEASAKKRASLHLLSGEASLASHQPGGLEVLTAPLAVFHERLTNRNHTLKRALTDPRLFSGIGNAYADEILHAARLSPLTWTSRLSDDEIARLFAAVQGTLREWTARLRNQLGGAFPEKVTAFRPEMAAHGRFGQPCPVCGTKIQRIVYADNETNYCPRCQTGGRVLADRSLSRLLKDDWPSTVEEWEG